MLSKHTIPNSIGQLAGATFEIDGLLNAGQLHGTNDLKQSSLPSRAAKSFALKKSLAQQVRAFMTAKTDASGTVFSPQDMAALVAAHQPELEEDKRCTRQNIEHLLNKDFKTVRYLPALAAAMGISMEELVRGKATPKVAAQATPNLNDLPSLKRRREDRLADALRIVGGSFRDAGEPSRKLALPYLQMLLSNFDETAEDNIPILLKHLLGGWPREKEEDVPTKSTG